MVCYLTSDKGYCYNNSCDCGCFKTIEVFTCNCNTKLIILYYTLSLHELFYTNLLRSYTVSGENYTWRNLETFNDFRDKKINMRNSEVFIVTTFNFNFLAPISSRILNISKIETPYLFCNTKRPVHCEIPLCLWDLRFLVRYWTSIINFFHSSCIMVITYKILIGYFRLKFVVKLPVSLLVCVGYI